VIERVVENWLTSVNERQYQIQFCQLLVAEGETVLYISKHGPSELGKDVITLDSEGVPRCYQLKRGDLGLSDWRAVEGEVNQLVEIDPNHPSLPANPPRHKSYFVTNGTLKDPVVNAITQRNLTWAKRDYGPLICIQKDELVSRFIVAHGKYFPALPIDVRIFLELYTADGAAPLNKQAFAGFIEQLLRLDEMEATPLEVRRAAASAVLFTSYALHNQTIANNHWAVFEGWVVAGAAILALATKHGTGEVNWSFSFDLCYDLAVDALERLCKECSGNETQFVQGSPFSDGYVYRARITILAGLLAALRLTFEEDGISDQAKKHMEFIDGFLFAQRDRLQLWGESAMPFFILSAMGLERRGCHALSESVLVQLIRTICTLNGKGAMGPGLTNPYWSAERSLRLVLGLELNNREEFLGHSYTLESLIHMLVRRGLKQTLKRLWASITEVDFAKLIFRDSYEWLIWEGKTAVLDTRFPNRPERWGDLEGAANSEEPARLPAALLSRPSFMAFFLLVYPHRCHPALVRQIDRWAASR
jgi:hypothetical protein